MMNRIRITVRLKFGKVLLKWAGFDILVGFEILAVVYAAHAIMWQLLEGRIDKYC
jgi:hypothetical protein